MKPRHLLLQIRYTGVDASSMFEHSLSLRADPDLLFVIFQVHILDAADQIEVKEGGFEPPAPD